tara:strand:- start:109 stop:669 length:561 start_codon:yes stop_codon:yes gene_type:complete
MNLPKKCINPIGVSSFQCFTPEQVKEINKKIKENIWSRQDPADAARGATKIGDFFYVPCPPMMDLLHPWMYECQHINKTQFGYSIYWDFHLEKFNYNVYGVGGGYEWHVDANSGDQPVDQKFTCVLNLSEEPYEGGEFYTIIDPNPQPIPSGHAICFNPLIAHKVTPVTKGKRITLTYWAQGPSWR